MQFLNVYPSDIALGGQTTVGTLFQTKYPPPPLHGGSVQVNWVGVLWVAHGGGGGGLFVGTGDHGAKTCLLSTQEEWR